MTKWGRGGIDWVVVSLLALTACASGAASPTPEPGQVALSRVELLAPGTGPLQVLRLTPKLGQKEQLVLTTQLSVGTSFSADQAPATTNLPSLALSCELEVTSVDQDGAFVTQLKVLAGGFEEDPAFPVDAAVELATTAEPLIGLTATSRTSDRGLVLAADVHVPSSATAPTRQLIENLKETLTQLALPLPVEAVGVGARWRVVSDLVTSGVRMRRTVMVELIELTGPNITLRTNVSQTAPRQLLKLADTPATTIVTLTSYEGRGEGELSLDLGRLVPDASHAMLSVQLGSHVSDPAAGELVVRMQTNTVNDIVPRSE